MGVSQACLLCSKTALEKCFSNFSQSQLFFQIWDKFKKHSVSKIVLTFHFFLIESRNDDSKRTFRNQLIFRTIFSHSLSKQFWKQNNIFADGKHLQVENQQFDDEKKVFKEQKSCLLGTKDFSIMKSLLSFLFSLMIN
jgi:hypothetical protein